MLTDYLHTLRRLRRRIIGWSVGIALYGLMMALFYPTIGQMGNFEEYISVFPDEMIAFFESFHIIQTPMGYIDVYFFSYLHVIIGIFAIGTSSQLLSGDEERGILDLVLAHPIDRKQLFVSRLLGNWTGIAVILAAGWLSWALPAEYVELGITRVQLIKPFLSLAAVLFLFSSLTFLLSMVLPSARSASLTSGALMVGNYLLMGLSNINEQLKPVMQFTPLRYYQGGIAIESLNVQWFFSLLGFSCICAAAAWLLFTRRNIRVGGEHSWNINIRKLSKH